MNMLGPQSWPLLELYSWLARQTACSRDTAPADTTGQAVTSLLQPLLTRLVLLIPRLMIVRPRSCKRTLTRRAFSRGA